MGAKLYGGDERMYLDLVAGRLGPEQREQRLLPWQALGKGRLQMDWAGRSWDFRTEPELWFLNFLAGGGTVGDCEGK